MASACEADIFGAETCFFEPFLLSACPETVGVVYVPLAHVVYSYNCSNNNNDNVKKGKIKTEQRPARMVSSRCRKFFKLQFQQVLAS